jgi:hypothetical protein
MVIYVIAMNGIEMSQNKSFRGGLPTIVTVPCFSGAPWDLDHLKPLSDLPLQTMRLPEEKDDIRRTCASLCPSAGGELEQIQFLLGHFSVLTTERYVGCKQKLSRAVNDRFEFFLNKDGWVKRAGRYQ